MAGEQHRLETKDVVELINEIEQALSVETWIINGFHLWPLLRIQLAFQLEQLIANPLNARVSQHLNTAVKKIIKIPAELQDYYFAKIIDKGHNTFLNKKTECFFYTYSSARRFRVHGNWYDVYCDPFIEKLSEKNISSTVLEYTDNSGFRIPRFHSSQFEHPLTLYFMQAKAVMNSSFVVPDELQQQLLLYQKFLLKHKFEHFFPDEMSLKFRILMIRQYAEYFKKIFEKIEPRFSFGSNYYGFREMGMNLACRETGVCSVDIQHGVQGKMHVAYGQWLKVPASGYEVMPRIFWNWSEEEKTVIDQWCTAANGAHSSIVGGNPLLEHFADETEELTKVFKSQVDTIIDSLPNNISKHILVTLQNGVNANAASYFKNISVFDVLEEVFMRSDKDYYWWIRLHPNMIINKERIRRHLQKIKTLRWNLTDATMLPLYALLQRVDLHITASSSVVIEAEHFGVPSILIHQQSKILYPNQIKNGIAVFAQSTEEIEKAIIMLSKQSSRSTTRIPPRMNSALDDLFTLVKLE